MISQIIFNALGVLILSVMAYVLWGGVGRKRPVIGRALAAVCAAIAGFLIWQVYELLF